MRVDLVGTVGCRNELHIPTNSCDKRPYLKAHAQQGGIFRNSLREPLDLDLITCHSEKFLGPTRGTHRAHTRHAITTTRGAALSLLPAKHPLP